MSDEILTGHDAIDYAVAHHLPLNKYTDPTEGAREGLTVEEARRIAAEDPSLIWAAAHRAFGVEVGTIRGMGGDYKIEEYDTAEEALARRDELRAEGYGDEHGDTGDRYVMAVTLAADGSPKNTL